MGKCPNVFLYQVKEPACMCAVHLCVVKLQRQREDCFQKSAAVFSPDQEWVVENSAVHSDSAVDLCVHDGRGTNGHVRGQIVAFTAFRNLARK